MANLNSIMAMREKEQIRQSIVKNNIFMLKKLGIDLESPNCIIDLFNNFVLFMEASEENMNAAKLLKDPIVNEVRYGAGIESDVGCSEECSCNEDVTNG